MPTLVLLCAAALSFTSQAAAQTTALVGARIIDGRGGVIEHGTIVMRDGTIAAVGPVASTPVPQDAERIDVRGATIMPGLDGGRRHAQRAQRRIA
jgi:imidazolonepropionase-like amidohydrolase